MDGGAQNTGKHGDIEPFATSANLLPTPSDPRLDRTADTP